jgi:hypothetical protein
VFAKFGKDASTLYGTANHERDDCNTQKHHGVRPHTQVAEELKVAMDGFIE